MDMDVVVDTDRSSLLSLAASHNGATSSAGWHCPTAVQQRSEAPSTVARPRPLAAPCLAEQHALPDVDSLCSRPGCALATRLRIQSQPLEPALPEQARWTHQPPSRRSNSDTPCQAGEHQ